MTRENIERSPALTDPLTIRVARIEEIFDLRWNILREGLPREAACFPGDDEPGTLHLGAFDRAGRNVGCASFMRRDWEGQPAWQLRGMAVSPELQKSGVGRRLLELAEAMLPGANHSTQLWCNARTPAAPFYRKLGWEPVGPEFIVETAGPHVRMKKLMK